MTDSRSQLLEYIEQALQETGQPPPVTVPAEPEDFGFLRQIRVIDDPPEWLRPEARPLDVARGQVVANLDTYVAEAMPTYMLLIKAAPGIGKTTFAVELAERLAREGKRVMYVGPRHDFFDDVLAKAGDPGLWYEWLPRQAGTETKPETCAYAEEIATWLYRGYESIDFCRSICGWDYVNRSCPYHGQKRRQEPIVFCQHQHVVAGHPLDFDVVLGDEQPIMAFCNHWRVPARWVTAAGMDPREPLAEMIHELSRLCDEDVSATGPDLLTLLGGAEAVLAACESWTMPATALVVPPEIWTPADAERAPYAFLQHLVPLLVREARAAAAGQAYPHRVIVAHGHLGLLLRNPPSDKLPPWLVWLDATANSRLYEACFRRKAKVVDAQPAMQGTIYQVYDRYNGKSSVLGKDGRPTAKALQLEQQVQRIVERGGYRRPAVITFKDLLEQMPGLAALDHAHFHAARGTNALEDADVLIVAGTPQPPTTEMEWLARMIFWERMTAFAGEFTARDLPYSYVDAEGKGRAYPVSGFWGDPDLQAILWSVREGEIIQAAHRCRPINHDVDIWLLTNVPLPELPPAELLSVAELMGAPAGVDAYMWPRVLEFAEICNAVNGAVTAVDLVRELGLAAATARRHIETLIREYGWQPVKAAAKSGSYRGGRRAMGASLPEKRL